MSSLYNVGNIFIKEYEFERITEFKLVREINEHGRVTICGVINEENEDKYVEYANENSYITVNLVDNENNNTILFEGIVVNIEIIANNNTRYLKIEALSKTFLMDTEKKTRSFQNESYSYGDIFSIINKDYEDIQASKELLENINIDKFLIQYNETDWEFLKRVSSQVNYSLIEESNYSGIRYSIGYSNSEKTNTLKEYNYSIKKDLQEYREKAQNELKEINSINCISYEVITREVLLLGNKVNFKNRDYYIYKSEYEIKNSELINKYTLKDEKGMKVQKIYNNELIGLSLSGSVKNTEKDMVKVSLDIDSNNTDSGERWFAYSTVYSSEDGTGWYCMPEIGDSIRLYFPNNVEKNAFVISSVNGESSNASKRSDPSIKSIGTKYGKEIVLKEDAVEIIGNGNLLMKLTDDGGIEVISNKKIILDAKESIAINGGKAISIEGKKGVDLLQSKANLKIKDDVVMKGGKVNIE